VNECGCIVFEEIDGRNLFPPHHRVGQILSQFVFLGERSSGGVYINHGHGEILSLTTTYLQPTEKLSTLAANTRGAIS
jgi:hypothetical protein